MTLKNWLNDASALLKQRGMQTPRLDAEIILAHTLKHSRTWLHAHDDTELDMRSIEIANARIDLRLDNVPIAYIIGHKEFYGRNFDVTPETLIPRPESEEIIELLDSLIPKTLPLAINLPRQLVDIGTGSGCLGITAKLEHPELEVTLLDISKSALLVAERNSRKHSAKISTLQSDLLSSYPFTPDIVLANLPYVDRAWSLERDLNHEPEVALFAENSGLAIIRRCFDELSRRMLADGYALFEADPRQWKEIDAIALKCGFQLVDSLRFAHAYQKV